jgi:hypothetical protein
MLGLEIKIGNVAELRGILDIAYCVVIMVVMVIFTIAPRVWSVFCRWCLERVLSLLCVQVTKGVHRQGLLRVSVISVELLLTIISIKVTFGQ